MKKSIVILTVILFSGIIVGANEFSIESLKSGAFNMDISKVEVTAVPVPVNPAKETPLAVGQDLVYKFQLVRDDLWRFKNDTMWLKSDINSLERDALRIGQGQSNVFFQSDLERMASRIFSYQNDAQRIGYNMKNLLTLAQKDQQLNRLATDMEWDAGDLLNRFQFDIENAANSLEWTVKSIKPELIGYNSQWDAMDISRSVRDVIWKLRDLNWDTHSLVQKTAVETANKQIVQRVIE